MDGVNSVGVYKLDNKTMFLLTFAIIQLARIQRFFLYESFNP